MSDQIKIEDESAPRQVKAETAASSDEVSDSLVYSKDEGSNRSKSFLEVVDFDQPIDTNHQFPIPIDRSDSPSIANDMVISRSSSADIDDDAALIARTPSKNRPPLHPPQQQQPESEKSQLLVVTPQRQLPQPGPLKLFSPGLSPIASANDASALDESVADADKSAMTVKERPTYIESATLDIPKSAKDTSDMRGLKSSQEEVAQHTVRSTDGDEIHDYDVSTIAPVSVIHSLHNSPVAGQQRQADRSSSIEFANTPARRTPRADDLRITSFDAINGSETPISMYWKTRLFSPKADERVASRPAEQNASIDSEYGFNMQSLIYPIEIVGDQKRAEECSMNTTSGALVHQSLLQQSREYPQQQMLYTSNPRDADNSLQQSVALDTTTVGSLHSQSLVASFDAVQSQQSPPRSIMKKVSQFDSQSTHGVAVSNTVAAGGVMKNNVLGAAAATRVNLVQQLYDKYGIVTGTAAEAPTVRPSQRVGAASHLHAQTAAQQSLPPLPPPQQHQQPNFQQQQLQQQYYHQSNLSASSLEKPQAYFSPPNNYIANNTGTPGNTSIQSSASVPLAIGTLYTLVMDGFGVPAFIPVQQHQRALPAAAQVHAGSERSWTNSMLGRNNISNSNIVQFSSPQLFHAGIIPPTASVSAASNAAADNGFPRTSPHPQQFPIMGSTNSKKSTTETRNEISPLQMSVHFGDTPEFTAGKGSEEDEEKQRLKRVLEQALDNSRQQSRVHYRSPAKSFLQSTRVEPPVTPVSSSRWPRAGASSEKFHVSRGADGKTHLLPTSNYYRDRITNRQITSVMSSPQFR